MSRLSLAIWLTTAFMMSVAVPRAGAQLPGDSVRLRLGEDRSWLYGRIIDTDNAVLTLAQLADTQRVALLDVRRLDVAYRRNKTMELLTVTAILSAAFGLTYLIIPAPEECVSVNGTRVCVQQEKPLSYAAWSAIGAATGLVVGGITLQLVPDFRWRAVIRR